MCAFEQTHDGSTAIIEIQIPRIPFGILTFLESDIMNFIIWLVVGGIIGWLASMLMKTNDQQGMILNVIVGVVGAMLSGWFISPLVGIGTINQNNFSLPAMFISFIGASILLAIVNVFRRGTTR